MTRRSISSLATALAIVLLGSCSEGPKAGELEVQLTTPNSDDGAIQFTATAVAPLQLNELTAACSGCKLFLVKISNTDYRGVITGNIAAGTFMRLSVPDTKARSSYSVQINAVASRTSAIRSVNGYSVLLK